MLFLLCVSSWITMTVMQHVRWASVHYSSDNDSSRHGRAVFLKLA